MKAAKGIAVAGVYFRLEFIVIAIPSPCVDTGGGSGEETDRRADRGTMSTNPHMGLVSNNFLGFIKSDRALLVLVSGLG